MEYINTAFWLVAGYVVGAVPFGLVLGRIFGGVDIRQHGSHNIGATNVLRVVGKVPALLTLILDGGKGALVVYVLNMVLMGDYFSLVGGILAVFGHCYSPFIRFKGGRGVATGLGVVLMSSLYLGLLGIVIWLSVFILSRISSLSSLTSFILMPIIALIFNDFFHLAIDEVLLLIILSWFIINKHRDNIARLLKGEEHKFVFSKSKN